MAVDFAVPLITNVKCAKLLAEALVRKYPLEVSSVDYKTSHTTHSFPGLVNISAFVPGLVGPESSKDFEEVTKASVGGGFTTSLIIPFGANGQITDSDSRGVAHASAVAHCNYTLSVVGSATNVQLLDDEIKAASKTLYLPFSDAFSVKSLSQQVASVAAHFAAWPDDKPVVTDAKASDLASVLLLASLNNRSVHVTDVRSQEDLLLVSLCKVKQLKVTCDVSVYALLLDLSEFVGVKCLPSREDQAGLWSNLDVIDAFSVGTLPYELARELGKAAFASVGIQEALPLLLTAVSDGRITLDAIKQRLHDNPVRIFGLPDQSHTQVEAIVRSKPVANMRKSFSWAPVDKTKLTGTVNRVIVHGQTVFLDGSLLIGSMGRDISSASLNRPVGDRRGSVSIGSASAGRPNFGSIIGSPGMAMSKLSDSVLPAHIVGPMQQMTTAAVASPNALAIASAPRVFSPLAPHPSFHRKNILTVKQFSHQDIHDLFSLAHEMRLQVERNGTLDILKGKVLCTLFYEPSTRTSASFDAAMKRCGGEVVQVTAERSSVLKGESLADTIRTLSCYADAIVIRHPEVGSSQQAAKCSPVPIINAGDGIGEHPTQVLRPSLNLFISNSTY